MVPDRNIELTPAISARELGRFFAVARARGTALTMMPACPVDAFWHKFQGQGEAFSTFCHQYADGDVAHLENQGYGTIDWAPLYHAMFGERLPAIWFYSPDGKTFHKDSWAAYRSGEVRLSWDCTPEISSRKSMVTQPKSVNIERIAGTFATIPEYDALLQPRLIPDRGMERLNA